MIQVDIRETKLIQLLQDKEIEENGKEQKQTKKKTPETSPQNIAITTGTLDLGDIIVCDSIIIERKSVADLYSSFIDGRYEEQSYRLMNLAEYHNHNIIYLIEGDLYKHKNKAMLLSAMVSLNYYKGFSVIRTNNIQETAEFIWTLAKKILKETKEGKKSYYSAITHIQQPHIETSVTEPCDNTEIATETNQDSVEETKQEPTEKDYVSVVKKCKKENITENNIDEIMLCQIPGISTQSALALIRTFGSIKTLMERYVIEGDAIFQGIKVVQTTGKEANIKKPVIQNLKKYLLKANMGESIEV